MYAAINGADKSSFRRGQAWSIFLWEWSIFCGSGQEFSNFLSEWAGLVKPFLELGGIDQSFSRSGQDWSSFLRKWMGIVKLSAEVSGNGQTC